MAPEPNPEPVLHYGTDPAAEYLVTTFPDGSRELAIRPAGMRTWGAPIVLRATT